MALEKQHHVVEVAANGLEALRALHDANFSFDVVLLDQQMPVMDGFSTIRAIRDHEQRRGDFRRLLVIAMSAGSDEETVATVLNAGCNDFLPKPFKMEKFNEMIVKHLTEETDAEKILSSVC